jgi:serine/threonine protein kinase/serine/threonine protein phosphatase PrpC
MSQLAVSVGQHSTEGRKQANEDFYGVLAPKEPLRTTKGIAAVIADGVSGSAAGRDASEACVKSFLSDYFSTPESWTVRTSVQKVLAALNRWLYGQGVDVYGDDHGLVSTLSAVVLKSTTAHLFHIGDTRVYLYRNGALEQLTQDHRLRLSGRREVLSRAMGVELEIDIEYQGVPLEHDDLLLMTTDGVHEYLTASEIAAMLSRVGDDLDNLCRALAEAALIRGSRDNLTAQILRVDSLPEDDEDTFYRKLTELPFPPDLAPGMILDGYRILRELHTSKRTQLYLAVDEHTGREVALKTPSLNYQDDPTYIELFLHEEWVGRRLQNPHIMRVLPHRRHRQCLYHVAEYVKGQTLRQWMHDHPRPSLQQARELVAQIAKGLRAFHRMQMIHQDLKPENIMIDRYGTAKIIDFGSTKIAGLAEIVAPIERDGILGTRDYTAPEYLMGYAAGDYSDLYSLGVMTYEMLTGRLPYGEGVADRRAPSKRGALGILPGWSSRTRRRQALSRYRYTPATEHNPEIPPWVDGALAKAVHPDPRHRYQALSEFLYDLSHPNAEFLRSKPPPLTERHPVAFWQGLSFILVVTNLILFYLASQ